jgi:hypothetical protein
VVQVEQGVGWGDEEVATRVAAHGVVAAAVDTEIRASRPALHGHLEVPNVLVLQDEAGNGGGIGPFFVAVVCQVALEAARVVGAAVAVGNGAAIGEIEAGRAEVNLCLERKDSQLSVI